MKNLEKKLPPLGGTVPRVFPVRTQMDFQLSIKDVERPKLGSMTIQEDSFTIREIMEKFTIHGETWEEKKRGLYQEEVTHDSEDLRQVMSLDLVDRDELLSEVKMRQAIAQQKIAEYRNKIDRENAEKVKEAEKKLDQVADDERSLRSAGGSTKYNPKTASKTSGKNSPEMDE